MKDEVKLYSSSTLVSAATVLTGATVASNGCNSMFISEGGTASLTTVTSRGVVYVSGGTMVSTTRCTYSLVRGEGNLGLQINSNSARIIISGSSTVSYDKILNNAEVVSGGKLIIWYGASVSDVIVNSAEAYI